MPAGSLATSGSITGLRAAHQIRPIPIRTDPRLASWAFDKKVPVIFRADRQAVGIEKDKARRVAEDRALARRGRVRRNVRIEIFV